LKGIADLGFLEPSPIQVKTIPFILNSEKDLIALAQTGTGKTAAFSLPILNKIKAGGRSLQAIILCPTRELCLQISQDIKKYAKYSKETSITAVYGGERIDLQIRELKRGANIVVGTPGRVHDLIRRKVLDLQNIKWLVLDEADEMLDMGFKDDLDAILKDTPKTKQTLLFSATMSKSVNTIAKKYMGEADEIGVGEKNAGADNVAHEYYIARPHDRFDALQRILDSLPGVYGILFCRTRNQTQEVAEKLKQANYDTEALHGDVSQVMRTKIMDRFKHKQVSLLVATDVAARGIDVSNLTHVINYNLPDHDEAYTHRSGRTGRAQSSGVSISILSPSDLRRIKRLEIIIGKKFAAKKIPTGQDVYRRQIDNFIKEIEEIEIGGKDNEKYFEEIANRLKKINKEDLIKRFIFNKFGHLMEAHKNARDLNTAAPAGGASRDKAGGVNLEINLGRKHNFDIKSLFALVNASKKLKRIKIGSIGLMGVCSVFSVDQGSVKDVIGVLRGKKFRGREVEINITAKKPVFGGGRNKRAGGSQGGGKRNFRRSR